MPKLSKMMYKPEIGRHNQQFGLSLDQMRCPWTVQNAGWFNGSGEKIGYGDLGPDDFRRITDEIDAFEVFLVLEEYQHRFNMPADLDWAAPGIDYVLSNVHMVIARDMLILVEKREPVPKLTKILAGLTFNQATPAQARHFVEGFLSLRTKT